MTTNKLATGRSISGQRNCVKLFQGLLLMLMAVALPLQAQTPHATGIDGATVYINDLEDHTWTYYSDKPDTQYPDALRSPNPRNVKITYRGGSVNNSSVNVQVSPTEAQNTFVYYKTIEKYAWGGETNTTTNTGRWLTGEYAYRVIPNPFSQRPKVGTTYYGFGGWQITAGAQYIQNKNADAVLGLEEKINFENLPYDANNPNAVTAEVELTATWVTATVVTFNKNANITNDDPAGLNTSGTYETNFIVVTDNRSHTVSGFTKGVTVSSRYPDGTAGGGSPTISGVTTNSAPVKIEYIKIGDGTTPVHPTTPDIASSTTIGSGTFQAQTGELIVGRGCTGTVSTLNSGGSGGKYQFRIESGKYQYMYAMQGGGSGDNYGRIVLGCDIDRAASDNADGVTGNGTGDNTKLRIVNFGALNGGGATGQNANSELLDITVKSGYYGFSANRNLWTGVRCVDGYGLGIGGNPDGYSGAYNTYDHNNNPISYSGLGGGTANAPTWVRLMSFYVGPTHGAGKNGVNRMLVEGGEFGSINGGGTNPGNENTIGFYFRMKGGWVKGAIYGTASISNSTGSRRLVFTGGEVNGWVAGGCNGTDFGNGDGKNDGTCYIYAGGTTEFRSHNRDGMYNNAYGLVGGVPGGQIFGAGRGLAPITNTNPKYCGSTTTAYLTVADESYVEQNVYGGGYNGVSQYSYVYVTGGTVNGKVFGGTAKAVTTDNTWRTRTTDVRMYGGTVLGGVYGSHDETGNQYNASNVQILGGTVGKSGQTANEGNVFGCGYGIGTSVDGDVVVIVGDSTSATHNTYPVIWGNVFGGGHEARYTVGTHTFKVLGYNGTVKQSIYGGGKGVSGGTQNEGRITGNTSVWLKGSIEVLGDVYGGGLAGEVTGASNVKISD